VHPNLLPSFPPKFGTRSFILAGPAQPLDDISNNSGTPPGPEVVRRHRQTLESDQLLPDRTETLIQISLIINTGRYSGSQIVESGSRAALVSKSAVITRRSAVDRSSKSHQDQAEIRTWLEIQRRSLSSLLGLSHLGVPRRPTPIQLSELHLLP
jgi:hypothetical protein